MERTFSAADQLCNLSTLAPSSQADLLTQLAQQARLVRLAVSAVHEEAAQVARNFEQALGVVMDADEDDASLNARLHLADVLTDARNAGLNVSATVEELTLDGVLGAQRLPVLTAFIGIAR